MYWPLGAPRVFAAPRKRKPHLLENNQRDEEGDARDDADSLLGLCVSRNGLLFATITATSLNIWQTSPVTLLTSVERSKSSISSYGTNVAVLLRPDSSIAAVQTSLGYLVTYNISTDPQSRVYQQIRTDEKAKRLSLAARLPTDPARLGQREVHIRFRMVIKIDAGIGKALALEDDLVVATEKPSAVQCIKWVSGGTSSQTTTELLNRLPWMNKKSSVVDIVFDRAMSLYVWISSDGSAYAVQKLSEGSAKVEGQGKFFRGYTLHTPDKEGAGSIRAAINARFSLLAVGCANGEVHVYVARDYAGSLPPSHKLIPPVSSSTTGALAFLRYSPDGYCIFVGYEKGWVMWSVYGKLGGSSFTSETEITKVDDDGWLMGVQDGAWISGGSQFLFIGQNDERLWVLDIARSAMTGCFGPANVSRMLLHTGSILMMYKGHDSSNIVSIGTDVSLWNHVSIPADFLASQHPIRSAVISPDGRYVAVAGRRGLAHYSVHSGRWKTFDNLEDENAFVVRGGMCWYQHILIVAVETDDHDEESSKSEPPGPSFYHYQIRLYSRELPLSDSNLVFVEQLPAPAVTITPSGDDSLLVYTQENILYHYVINTVKGSLQLAQVGQIGLHGIVRAPARVRAVTWYIPEHQLLDGDPSQDVMCASVLFLVDARLVLLQPTKDEAGDLKYDMKIVANDVEYFSFTRDQIMPQNFSRLTPSPSEAESPSEETALGLAESLWYFDGQNIQCWPDIQDLLRSTAIESSKELPQPVVVPVDFYPTSVALSKGVVIGLESDLYQRRDSPFAFCRFTIRTQLFLPAILRHYLAVSDATSALSLCHHYQRLPYFSHALEVLLHTVLDDEVDSQPTDGTALLPSVLSFLSSFPGYLEILVQCTRKTEVRSWRTLFATLPPPRELFEESLRKGQLKTAGGYLLVLHTLEEDSSSSDQASHLLRMAKQARDWDLCKELARFLMALDPSGDTLREVMERLELQPSSTDATNSHTPLDLQTPSDIIPHLRIPRLRGIDDMQDRTVHSNGAGSMASSPGNSSDSHYEGARDYFSRPGSSSVQPS